MCRIALLAWLFLSLACNVCSAKTEKNFLEQSHVQAMQIYMQMVADMYPYFDVNRCEREMTRVLNLLTGLPKELNLAEDHILVKLRALGCIDRHFHLVSEERMQSRGTEQCGEPALSLERYSGIWVLKVRDFWEEAPNFGNMVACRERKEEFRDFIRKIWRYELGPWRDDPLILDMRDNAGGSSMLVEIFLGALFSPSPGILAYADAYRRGTQLRRSGVWMTKTGFFRCPKAILVDAGTASNGEVVVGVLHEWCPTTPIIGQTTYGKTAGTRILPVGHFVVWFTSTETLLGPAQRIEKGGIVPDIETEPGEELETALKYIEEHPTATER